MNLFLISAFVGLLCGTSLGDIDVGEITDIGEITDVGDQAPSRELHVSKVEQYVTTDEGTDTLKAEYHSIKGGQRRPWTVASLPENIKKNRYDDLLAFDDTRVILKKLPNDSHSDYINANYIDGYNRRREYIATQGPLEHTIGDFWRMIWQAKARKIIMLANVLEHGKPKVAKYWPDVNASYGEIEVTKLSEFTIPDVNHVVRTFSVKKGGESKRRIIRHFHFTGWPDLGVPSDRLSIVSLLRQARKYRPHDTAPLVVHCSAGVGRTGTVILTDSMLQRAMAEKSVDFPKRLDHMRVQRVDVVEKEGQYIFAHEAIHDFFYGNTTDEYLKRIENIYNDMDSEEGYEDSPSDMSEALRRMKYHSSKLVRLIDDMVNLHSNMQHSD